jgi:hypothetical protein
MAKKRIAEPTVRRTGNILRTVLIWIGAALALLAGLILMVSQGNERVVLGLLVVAIVVYGFVLRDFDVDDDD